MNVYDWPAWPGCFTDFSIGALPTLSLLQSSINDGADFKAVADAMKVIGFTADEVQTVYKILATILHLVKKRNKNWGSDALPPMVHALCLVLSLRGCFCQMDVISKMQQTVHLVCFVLNFKKRIMFCFFLFFFLVFHSKTEYTCGWEGCGYRAVEIKKVPDFSGAGLIFPHCSGKQRNRKKETSVRCDKDSLRNERTGGESNVANRRDVSWHWGKIRRRRKRLKCWASL